MHSHWSFTVLEALTRELAIHTAISGIAELAGLENAGLEIGGLENDGLQVVNLHGT